MIIITWIVRVSRERHAGKEGRHLLVGLGSGKKESGCKIAL